MPSWRGFRPRGRVVGRCPRPVPMGTGGNLLILKTYFGVQAPLTLLMGGPAMPVAGPATFHRIGHGQSEAVMPPSTKSVWPLTKLEASEARKIAAPTSSSTSPQRPAGVRLASQAENSGSPTSAALSGVSK